VQNADIGISHHSMDNQQKKEHLMKSGILAYFSSALMPGYADMHMKTLILEFDSHFRSLKSSSKIGASD
jgi:hypothetical protein